MAAPCGFDRFHRQGSQVKKENCIYRFRKYRSVGSEGYDAYRYRCHRAERRTCHSFQRLVRQIVEERDRSDRARGAAAPGDLSNLFPSSRLVVQTNRCSMSPWRGGNDWCQSPRCVIPVFFFSYSCYRDLSSAGIPTIIKPFFGDQFFWADRVEALGIGSGVRKLTVENLAEAFVTATTDQRQISRAKLVGEQIRSVCVFYQAKGSTAK